MEQWCFSDISVRIDDVDVGIIIKVKYAENGRLEEECQKAIEQIDRKRYQEALWQEGIHTVLKYGIACYRKKCRVVLKSEWV